MGQDIKKLSIIYLMKNKQEIPVGMERLFDKLIKYEDSIKDVSKAIDEASDTIKKLASKYDQLTGSVLSLVDLIAEDLPEDKIEEWSSKLDSKTENQA